METRASKTFSYGFVLAEQDLRRLMDLARNQLTELTETTDENYEVQFANGAVARTTDLEQVLSQENDGSGRIVRIKVQLRGESELHPAIELDFKDLRNVADEKNPVAVRVQANSRNWVFVTISLLEERIQKIRRFAILRYVESPLAHLAALGYVAIIFFVMLGDAFIAITDYSGAPQRTYAVSSTLRQNYEEGRYRDPTEAYIAGEELKEAESRQFLEEDKRWHEGRTEALARGASQRSFWIIVLIGFPFACLMGTWFIGRWFYPLYNFCWGDYLSDFGKREAARKFIIVTIIIGITVSIIGSLLTNLLAGS